MIETLLKLYELNEKYHDTKEKMAWLASSLYAVFSVAFFKYAHNVQLHDLKDSLKIGIIAFSIGTFICVLRFINFQSMYLYVFSLRRRFFSLCSRCDESTKNRL